MILTSPQARQILISIPASNVRVNVHSLFVFQEGLAPVVLPMLEAWRSIRPYREMGRAIPLVGVVHRWLSRVRPPDLVPRSSMMRRPMLTAKATVYPTTVLRARHTCPRDTPSTLPLHRTDGVRDAIEAAAERAAGQPLRSSSSRLQMLTSQTPAVQCVRSVETLPGQRYTAKPIAHLLSLRENPRSDRVLSCACHIRDNAAAASLGAS
ncbi:hypothetical protein MES5069_450049 [Mesorhizobium escarrei]|uniref:Uncharacterized protein n=1 Tax=Mesorhizobium escarrei TaxID=666018 RepID=A0ABN8K6B5_9HYPH|nr:hypothetical protein MES5069_450049 [Mesorhizobium escarrei]